MFTWSQLFVKNDFYLFGSKKKGAELILEFLKHWFAQEKLKGQSINDVRTFHDFFDPLSPSVTFCHTFLYPLPF